MTEPATEPAKPDHDWDRETYPGGFDAWFDALLEQSAAEIADKKAADLDERVAAIVARGKIDKRTRSSRRRGPSRSDRS